MTETPMTFSYRGKLASEMSKEELCCIILELDGIVKHLNAENLRLKMQPTWPMRGLHNALDLTPASDVSVRQNVRSDANDTTGR